MYQCPEKDYISSTHLTRHFETQVYATRNLKSLGLKKKNNMPILK